MDQNYQTKQTEGKSPMEISLDRLSISPMCLTNNFPVSPPMSMEKDTYNNRETGPEHFDSPPKREWKGQFNLSPMYVGSNDTLTFPPNNSDDNI